MNLEPKYLWRTPSGDEVEISTEIVEALARIQKHFPGAKAQWWRKPGEKWKRT